MSCIEDSRKREVAILTHMSANVSTVHDNIGIASSGESSAIAWVETGHLMSDFFSSSPVTDDISTQILEASLKFAFE